MAFLDSLIRPIAKNLVNQFGASVVLTRVTGGTYAPGTSSATPTEVTVLVKAVVEDYNLVDSGAGFASGMVLLGDKKITVAAAALTYEPNAGDKVKIGSDLYTIVRVMTTYSGDQPAIFELQARR